ncbi:MAG: arsenite methyltransferase [Candidatus Thermoplasmatota archaeon]|nr:arsenite methyltransferase [Candidatus Thermoplasmatota archaeon]
MESYIRTFKALTDDTRLRALIALQHAGRELCVCELADALNETQYNISRHMKILKDAGIVQERKDGRWVFYHLKKPEEEFMVKIFESISCIRDEALVEDNRRLNAGQAVRGGGKCDIKIDKDESEGCCAREERAEDSIKDIVRKKYGDLASESDSCCSGNSCFSNDVIEEEYGKEDIASVPAESIMGLGCGNPLAFAEIKEGDIVLDLGSGSGFDCFLASKNARRVIGVDMTEEMIIKSKELAERYGYRNVEFMHGEIEDLPVDDNAIDVIMSNCVINLSPDKEKVFSEAYRVLKPEGRMVISDIVLEGDLPEEVKRDPDAWCSCVAGAMRREDYLGLIKSAGFDIVSIDERPSDDVITSITIKAKKGGME